MKFILLKLILNATPLNSLEGFLFSVSLSLKTIKDLCPRPKQEHILSFVVFSVVRYKADDCLKTYTCQQFVRKLRQHRISKEKCAWSEKTIIINGTSLIRGSRFRF